jgi:hypothetical protein
MSDREEDGFVIYGVARRRSRVRSISVLLMALACGAATFQTIVNAADWRKSDDAARAVLCNPRSSPEQKRDAIFVLGQHEKKNAASIKQAAEESGIVGEHARNALAAIRDDWR